MDDRLAVWRAAAELARSDAVGALATVSRHRGSLPMARDSKMLVAADGRRWGTVGGGCVEADVTEQGLAAAQQGAPATVRHTLNADVAGDVGLSCGGTVDLFLEPLVATPEMATLYGAVASAIEGRNPATVVTGLDWRAGPRKLATVGGEAIAVGEALKLQEVSADAGAPFVDTSSQAFVEPIPRVPRVIIFGAGHVGAEIARVAGAVGFYVVVIDDRADFANPERLPDAREIMVEDFRSVLERLEFDQDDYVLATTRGHSYDAYIVEKTAPTSAGYVGMLGSGRKRAVIWRALEQSGVPRAALDRVRVPIGEAIGADTPAEIGVAVVAELIKLRRLGGPVPRRVRGADA